jgi:hypothetical protein
MLRRYIVPSLIALTMILGATSASSNEVAIEPLPGQTADAMMVEHPRAEAAAPLGLPADLSQKNGTACAATDTKESDKAHPCDSACDCCGLTGAGACCDKCWTCWYQGGG